MAEEKMTLPDAQGEKKAWLSKTLVFNFVMAGLVIFWPAASEYIQAHPEVVALFWSSANIVLRLITKDKLAFW